MQLTKQQDARRTLFPISVRGYTETYTYRNAGDELNSKTPIGVLIALLLGRMIIN